MKNKLLYFDSMVTPKIINFVYWIVLILGLGFGILALFKSRYYYSFSLLEGLTETGKILLYMLAGVLAVRIFCELLIVIFKINENLNDLNNNTKWRK